MKILWAGIGWTCVGLAVVGTALPVMPTVPFLLVAAWAFSKSSPALRARIRHHPRYGPMIRAWQDRGVVPRLAKVWAIAAMSFGVGLGVWLKLPVTVVAVQAAVCLAIAAFLVTRPER